MQGGIVAWPDDILIAAHNMYMNCIEAIRDNKLGGISADTLATWAARHVSSGVLLATVNNGESYLNEMVYFERCCKASDRSSLLDALLQEFLVRLTERGPQPHCARFMVWLAEYLVDDGLLSLARQYLHASLSAAQAHRDCETEIGCLLASAGLAHNVADYEGAAHLWRDALGLTPTEDHSHRAGGLIGLGMTLAQSGAWTTEGEADAAVENGIAEAKRGRRYDQLQRALEWKASRLDHLGLIPEAIDVRRELLAYAQGPSRRPNTVALAHLAVDLCAVDRVGEAKSLLEEAGASRSSSDQLRTAWRLVCDVERGSMLVLWQLVDTEWSIQIVERTPQVDELVRQAGSKNVLWTLRGVRPNLDPVTEADAALQAVLARVADRDAVSVFDARESLAWALMGVMFWHKSSHDGSVDEGPKRQFRENWTSMGEACSDGQREFDRGHAALAEICIDVIDAAGPRRLDLSSQSPAYDSVGTFAYEADLDSRVLAGRIAHALGDLREIQDWRLARVFGSLMVVYAGQAVPEIATALVDLGLMAFAEDLVISAGRHDRTLGEAGDRLANEMSAAALSGATSRKAEDLLSVARAQFRAGRTLEAIGLLQVSAQMAEDPHVLADIHGHLGMAFRRIGAYREALDAYASARSLGEQMADVDEVAMDLHLTGNIYFDLARYREAEVMFRQSLRAYAAADNNAQLAMIFSNYANLAGVESRIDKSLWYRRIALDFALLSNTQDMIIDTSQKLAAELRNTGEYQRASERLYWTLATAESVGAMARVANILNDLGHLQADPHNPVRSVQEAIASHTRALELAAATDSTIEEGDALLSLAHIESDDVKKAIQWLDRAIAIFETIPHSMMLAQAQREKALALMGWTSDSDAALEALRTGLDALDARRGIVLSTDVYTGHLERVYSDLAQLGSVIEAQRDHIQDALAWSERGRTVLLRELLASRSAGRGSSSPETMRDLVGRARSSPKGEAATLEQILERLQEHENERCLVEFTLELGEAFVFAVVPGVGVRSRSLEFAPDALRQSYGRLMSGPDAPGLGRWSDSPDLARLVEAVVQLVPEGAPLVLVPHREMHHLPLHALPWEGGCLLDRNPISYAPSATTLTLSPRRRLPARKKALILGNVFEQEAVAVSNILGVKPVLGVEGNKDWLMKALPSSDVIHLSTHGSFSQDYPAISSVLLTGGDQLTAEEVGGLELKATLVALSACRSGEARVSPGDDLQGLTQAFVVAGAAQVVSSLWNVNAQAADVYMRLLYSILPRVRWDAALANREAQALLRSVPAFAREIDWAPWIVTGLPPI
jgi:tetratricopeptide (TPR) repeat protein